MDAPDFTGPAPRSQRRHAASEAPLSPRGLLGALVVPSDGATPRVRGLARVILIVGTLAGVGLTQVFATGEAQLTPAELLVLLGGGAALGLTPLIRRINTVWDHLGGLTVIAYLAALVATTGGPDSPYRALYLLNLVFGALFYARRRFVAETVVTAGVMLAPLGYADPASPVGLVVLTAVSVTAAAFVHYLARRLGRAADAAAVSEQRFRSLFEHNSNAVFSIDPSGAFEQLNQRAEELSGWSEDQLRGRRFHELVHPEDLPAAATAFAGALAGDAQRLSVQVVRRDGELRDLEAVAIPMVVNGHVVGLYGMAEDVTERNRAEAAIRLADRLRAAVAELGERVLGMRTEEEISAAAAAAAERVLELPVRAVFDPDGLRLLPAPSDPDELQDPLHGLNVRGLLSSLERVAMQAVERLRDEQAIADSERRARHSSRRLEALIATAPIAVVEVGPDGTIDRWNAAATRRLGWPAAEVIGREPPYVAAEDADAHRAILDQTLAGRQVSGVPVRAVDRDGTPRQLMLYAAPRESGPRNRSTDRQDTVVGPTSVVDGAVVFLVDVTTEKRLQDELQRARTMEALGRLAGGVAHDFNNLLTIIQGSADLLAEDLPSGPLHEDAQAIRAATRRATALTRDLLDMARRGASPSEVVDLSATLRNVVETVERAVGPAVEFRAELPGTPLHVRANPGGIEQVVLNLALNARDAMPDGGAIELRLHRITGASNPGLDPTVAEWAVLELQDTGTGMPADVRDRAFEPFFTTKGAGEGTGLGLAAVYGYVERAGGRVELRSHPGAGTTVEVFLPMVDVQAETADTATSASPRSELDGVQDPVLVVDDSAPVRRLVRRTLEHVGLDVLEAGDADEAVRTFRNADGRCALLITDVVMPGTSGIELADRLRAGQPGLPVLLISGHTTEDPGGYPLLPKPFARDELVGAVLRELLADRRRGAPAN